MKPNLRTPDMFWFNILVRASGLMILTGALAAFSSGCEKASAGGMNTGAADPSPAPASGVKLEQQQLKSISVEELTPQTTVARLQSHGKVSFNEDRTAPILAPVGGQIVGLAARVGDRVEKGQLLFYVKSREVAGSRSENLEARRDLELATKTNTMTEELFRHDAASQIAVQQAQNDLAKAQTRVLRTQEQLRVMGITPPAEDAKADAEALDPRLPVRAPLDGVVVDRHVIEGQFVQGDATALLTVADLSTLWVTADVFERDLRAIKLDQKAELTTLAYPNERFAARVTFINHAVDPVSRAVKVRLVVENPDLRLKPEMFAQVNVFLSDPEPAITVPARAVLSERGRSYVYVCVGPAEFTDREVEVEPLSAERMRVMRGLVAGDRVVTDGAILLRGQQDQSPTAG